MKKNILSLFIFFIFFAAGYYLFSSEKEQLSSIKRSQIIMGTIVAIELDEIEPDKAEKIITGAFNEIKIIDSVFSTYNPSGEVFKINHSTDTIVKVSPEVYSLISYALSITNLSEGAFDIGLNKLIDLWGFDNEKQELPDDKVIKKNLLSSGFNNIELKSNGYILKKNNAGLNFSAIAKGYGVDKAYEYLKNKGVSKAYINAGGEIRVIGDDWITGIQHPREDMQSIAKIKLSNQSAATSGDYEKYFILNGKRYHHILNPKTGYPSTGVQSVTIITSSCIKADALSTAVFVLGVKKGMELINSLPDTEGMIIDSAGCIHYSREFHFNILPKAAVK